MHERTVVIFNDVELPGVKAVVEGIDRKKFNVWLLPGFGSYQRGLVAVRMKDKCRKRLLAK